MQRDHQPIDQATQDARHGIDFFPKDHRRTVEQQVTDDTACRSRDAAHGDGYPKGVSADQRLLDAGYREQSQAKRIKEKPRIVQMTEQPGEEYHHCLGKKGAYDVHR